MKVAKLQEDAKLPTRKNPTDAGIDFYSNIDIEILPHTYSVVSTGVTVEIPEHCFMLLKPKGKNNYLVGAGVVDSFYHPGEILIKIFNPTDISVVINKGDSIAQGVLLPIITSDPEEVTAESLKNSSDRSGKGGITKQVVYLQGKLEF